MSEGTRTRTARTGLILGALLITNAMAVQAATITPSPPSSTSIDEHFEGYAKSIALDDGANFGPWHVVFDGVDRGRGVFLSKGRLRLAPQVSPQAHDTNSTLVVSRQQFSASPLQINATWTTRKTTRIGTPNPWETAWLVWDYLDPDHFTYLILKPNGWEVGRRDPSSPGTQRFIADADLPLTPVGITRTVTVSRSGDKTMITVNGTPLTSFSLPIAERHGSVGMYTEDAVVDWTRFQAFSPAAPSTPAASPASS